VAAQGAQHAYGLKRLLTDGCDENGEIVVPDCVRKALAPLVRQIDAIAAIDDHIQAHVKADDTARRPPRPFSAAPKRAGARISAFSKQSPKTRK
jgi:hypothetical protein